MVGQRFPVLLFYNNFRERRDETQTSKWNKGNQNAVSVGQLEKWDLIHLNKGSV